MKSFRQVATGGSAVSLVKFKSPLIPAPRWTFSLLLGIAVHLLAALMLIGWVHHVTPQGMLPPAVIMDLAMYQQMATPAADVPPGPEQNMAAPERVKQPEKKSEDLPKLTRAPQGTQAIRTELQVKKAKPTPELNDLPLPVVARNSAPRPAPLYRDSHRKTPRLSPALRPPLSAGRSTGTATFWHTLRAINATPGKPCATVCKA
ncbi:hypothetical protein [Serratia liquefaciens]|uniref:hypothetical protein n=1 Tax=Serratia liquefaciens TaxID=614 RepID=UPI002183E39A|nr:hypothetical protein [Serratia liquefaciens]CAI2412260.1 Uncharacterised protein [Serratia liquefaciens]